MYVSCQHCSKAATRNFSQQSKPQQKLSFMWHFVMILLMFSLCTTNVVKTFFKSNLIILQLRIQKMLISWNILWKCKSYKPIRCDILKILALFSILSLLSHYTGNTFFMILSHFQMYYDDNSKCLSTIQSYKKHLYMTNKTNIHM